MLALEVSLRVSIAFISSRHVADVAYVVTLVVSDGVAIVELLIPVHFLLLLFLLGKSLLLIL